MNVTRLECLAEQWRTEAAQLRHRGLDREAHLIESMAADFEEAVRKWELEELTLEAAAAESGFAYSTLQQRIAAGDLPNAGGKGSPRIRRCDLPSRGAAPARGGDPPDLAARILEHA